ncbi:hypothetical protein MLD38_018677 [Melastoma candidum]|uniref:Uncharacterized protein n=1 Tax=Melastoma candidum TaxID=119954 RepID=A0ACB9QUK7_9MYRT|nr:hypothetical protein MLD38_018677 [Melastoma candidum]
MKLYSNYLSSCSHRVRIAIRFKGLAYEYVPVDFSIGEHLSPEYSEISPLNYVPTLVDDDGMSIADSLAIIIYLEEKYPQNPLLPTDPQKKAINLQVASIVSSSIQPLQVAIMKLPEDKVSRSEKLARINHHIGKGFYALEELLKGHAGIYATGDEVFLGDLFIAPQIHAAVHRFGVDMSQYPLLSRLNEAYNLIPCFQDSVPNKQPDAPAAT